MTEQDNNKQRLKSSLESISPGSRIVHYEELIHNAEQAYSAYLEKHQELERVKEIFDKL